MKKIVPHPIAASGGVLRQISAGSVIAEQIASRKFLLYQPPYIIYLLL